MTEKRPKSRPEELHRPGAGFRKVVHRENRRKLREEIRKYVDIINR